jgi:hypothetical protein
MQGNEETRHEDCRRQNKEETKGRALGRSCMYGRHSIHHISFLHQPTFLTLILNSVPPLTS